MNISATNIGEPAFPRSHATEGHNGMELRDYFAAKALQGLIAEPPWGDGGEPMVYSASRDFVCKDPQDRFAYVAYKLANAMIKARAL